MTNLESVTSHRTQLYLPTSLFLKLKDKIRQENLSLAEFVRRLLQKEFQKDKQNKKKIKEKSWEKFLAAAGIGKGPKDLSYNHDKYFNSQK